MEKTLNDYIEELQNKNFDNTENDDLYYSNYNFND